MRLPPEGKLLRIFIEESNRHEDKPLYEWLVHKAKEHGLAGATVLRGLMGFGTHSHIHTSRILRLSMDLPIIVEIVDTPEKIQDFLAFIEPVIKHGLVTLEKAEIHTYKSDPQAE